MSDPGYDTFKSSTTGRGSRKKMVYQAANDGMLHAFDALTGAEEWAYIPALVLPALNNLTRVSGFTHKYYVDATPAFGDVDFGRTGGTIGTADWRTILVGGLGKGGRGYYALDISTADASDTETGIASKVLWEFPNSATASTANIGFSYSRPIIVKTKAQGWVVLVASGYNNGTDTAGTVMAICSSSMRRRVP